MPGFGKVVAFDALVAGYELVDCLPFNADDRGSEKSLRYANRFRLSLGSNMDQRGWRILPSQRYRPRALDQNVAKMRAGTGAGHEWPDEWQLYDYYVDAVDLQVLGSRSRHRICEAACRSGSVVNRTAS